METVLWPTGDLRRQPRWRAWLGQEPRKHVIFFVIHKPWQISSFCSEIEEHMWVNLTIKGFCFVLFFKKKTYDIISCGGPTPGSQSNAGVNAVDMLWACGCALVWPFASICVWYYGPGDLVQLRVLAVKDTEFSRSPCLVRLSFGSVV